MRRTQNFTPTPVDRKDSKSPVSYDPGDYYCCSPPLDTTSFENGHPTTEELLCSPVSEEKSVTAMQRAFRIQFHSAGWFHTTTFRIDICREIGAGKDKQG
jgi:hypothetical protein